MKRNVIITHTEILCLAIRTLEAEIQDAEWMKEQNEPKIEALKQMYLIETGVEY